MRRFLRRISLSSIVSIHAPRHRGAMPLPDQFVAHLIQFQSTPPVTEGRCAAETATDAAPQTVSIHAPRHRGAMPCVTSLLRLVFPVSIHAPRHRGAMPDWPAVPIADICVSIHAPRHRGAMRVDDGITCRVLLVSIHAPRHRGAMHDMSVIKDELTIVSIHAPRHRGAMQLAKAIDRDDLVVSIHAPRHRGAMPTCSATCASTAACFNPRPPSPRGDAKVCADNKIDSIEFQSTPPVTEGRCRSPPHCGIATRRVSIHAPRHRGAMRDRWTALNGSKTFQSTPPVTEGRCSSHVMY